MWSQESKFSINSTQKKRKGASFERMGARRVPSTQEPERRQGRTEPLQPSYTPRFLRMVSRCCAHSLGNPRALSCKEPSQPAHFHLAHSPKGQHRPQKLSCSMMRLELSQALRTEMPFYLPRLSPGAIHSATNKKTDNRLESIQLILVRSGSQSSSYWFRK